MKTKVVYLVMSLLMVAVLNSCSNEDFTQEPTEELNAAYAVLAVGVDNRSWPLATGTISGVISSNTTLTDDKVWFIDGPTFVQPGVTLTIDANTLIKGKTNPAQGSASYLVITRGARIVADGESASTSIVFTSDKNSGSRTAGDWGGLIVLGDAETNKPNSTEIEGIEPTDIPSGVSVAYGGSNNSHDGGILRYVRIEFAGEDLGNGNEINGLTLGGVGYGTELDYIQVSHGLDDGFEFFGGKVDGKHLVAFGNADDDFDFDQGYTGNIQFAVSEKVAGAPFSGDPNGIECDNDENGTTTTPITRPVISNMTVLGLSSAGTASSLLYGNRWRRNTSFVFRNSVIAGYDEHGVLFDGAAVANKLNGGSAEFKNNLVHSFGTPVISPVSATALPNYVANTTNSSNANFMELLNPYNTSNPDFRYNYFAAPSGIENPDFTGMPAFFDSSVYHVGAFGDDASTRWDDVWASYQPNNNPY